ncbi:MAG TPA: site-specific integrase [Arenimonas sp.]|uniref:site-specific integrase n=1 Tax=Arenimonas sp. TaxID=1872635 RepID=UPI002D80179E|nr:site-specific integrase [Arenimonas sp.]HEU0153309.1 site-specific integrase [Arenimonas sp.]
MRTTLTKRIVATSPPQERPYEIRDMAMKGLILRVQPSGYKAFIVEWARGKRRTLGAAAHLSLDDARAQTLQAMSEALQQRLPAIAGKQVSAMPLGQFLSAHYEGWAVAELRGGARYVERIRKSFPDWLGLPLDALDTAKVEAWWRGRVHAPKEGERLVTKATASRDLACLRSALSKAVEWKLLEANPLLGLRNKTVAPRSVVRYLSPAEEKRLRATLARRDAFLIAGRESANQWRDQRDRPLYPVLPRDGYGDHLTPLVLLAMNTGLRRRELLTLRWADINLEAKILTVRAAVAKSGKQRFIPLNADAHRALSKWAAQGGADGEVFGIRDAKTAWRNLLEAAEITDFRFHDLRHHFASRLVRVGVDLNTVRELLGHADIKMTLRYAHLCPDTLAAAVARLS